MKPTLDIPDEVVVDEKLLEQGKLLQRDLNRLTDGLLRYGEQVNRLLEPLPEFPRLVLSGTAAAKYDEVLRVAPVLQETVVTVQLPAPRTVDGGRSCMVCRFNTRGDIVVRPVGVTLAGRPVSHINGRPIFRMYGCLGMTRFTFDGVGFWSDNPGYRDWSDTE